MKSQLDGNFIKKKNYEEELSQLQKKEKDLETLAKLKVKELGEKGVQEYVQLEKSTQRFKELVNAKKQELAEISFR